MDMVDVAIVGAGPTGLALACELRLAGVTCRVLERRADQPNLTRAFAVHARTLELLDARGLADELVPQGIQVTSVQPAPGAALSLGELPTRYPMVLIVAQSGTEKLLEERAVALGAEIVRAAEVTSLTQDEGAVTLHLKNHDDIRASFVVGCDGAHSTVRDAIGARFEGAQYETHIMLADVQLQRPPQETLFGATSKQGLVLFVPFGDSWFRAIVWDRDREGVPLDEPLTVEELKKSFRDIAGDDYGMSEPRWSTRFLSERRQAKDYRVGRVFLAGDAAHVHSPIGGQGMNTGIQDAMNLGWKLAAAVRGNPAFLDTYQVERHPVGESVLKLTDALYRLVLSGSTAGLMLRRTIIRLAVRIGPVRRALAERLSGLAIRYPHPDGLHMWTGRRMPDLRGENARLYEVMRDGRFTLVTKEPSDVEGVNVFVTKAKVPDLILVRPDGYVAWASDTADGRGLDNALKRWCAQA